MQCAIYTRVAARERGGSESNSLDQQRESCARYINSQGARGWSQARVYEDEGFSGRDLNRPGLQGLLRDMRDRKIDIILAYSPDRISRSVGDLEHVLDELRSNDVGFVFVRGSFGSEGLAS